MSSELIAITDADVQRVAEFLHAHLDREVPAELWAECIDVPWETDAPNAGFMLVDDGGIVGAHLAFYSERTIDGRQERFCNLGAWCVLPDYRPHSLRLLMALLSQEGYHFTDLTPAENVVALNRRLRFRSLDTTSRMVPNLPWPSWRRGDVVSSDPALIERTLSGDELRLYRDHAAAKGARHLVLIRDGEWCYVIFRRFRRRRLRCVSIHHVSNADLFVSMARPLARHLLLHHGAPVTIAENRTVRRRPQPSFSIRDRPPKMFRSPSLRAAQIDDLYSELVCQPW